MMNIRLAFVIPLFVLAAAGCSKPGSESDDHGHSEAAASEVAKSAHGGRLLEQDGHAVELQIFEAGVPPQFRAWLYRDQYVVEPAASR